MHFSFFAVANLFSNSFGAIFTNFFACVFGSILFSNEICNVILHELIDKRNDLNEKIDDITKYKGVDGVIPTEFKGESITITESHEIPVKLKPKFDM